MTQDEANQAEWEDPDNLTGPPGLSIYFSKRDSRCFVPKQLRGFGPTMNLGTKCGFYWLFLGTLFLVVAAFLVGKCTAEANAQEPISGAFSFDAIEVDSSNVPGATCYRSARYIVVERRKAEAAGSDFFIRKREDGRCDADSLHGDFVLRDEWAAYFSALHGDVLLLDSGTGPDMRNLILVNLATRQRLAELSYVELIPGPDSATVGLWDGYYLEKPQPGCKMPPGGLIPGVDSLFFVDVRTGRKEFAGRTRCAQRQ